jgi:hypothetical protein
MLYLYKNCYGVLSEHLIKISAANAVSPRDLINGIFPRATSKGWTRKRIINKRINTCRLYILGFMIPSYLKTGSENITRYSLPH